MSRNRSTDRYSTAEEMISQMEDYLTTRLMRAQRADARHPIPALVPRPPTSSLIRSPTYSEASVQLRSPGGKPTQCLLFGCFVTQLGSRCLTV